MKKPGQYAARRVRILRRTAARKHWRTIALAAACYCGIMGLLVAYVARFTRPMLSFTLGGIVVGLAWFCKEFATAFAPVGNLPYGALAEEWTAHMLKKGRRDWTVIHGIEFLKDNGACSDIDHVAIGPNGVLAIETKFLGQGRPGEPPWRLGDHLAQARWGASKIRLKLHREHRFPVEVTPVLCLWGPGANDIPSPAYNEGVLVVVKPDDLSWLDAVPARLDDAVRSGIIDALTEFARRQERSKSDEAKRHAPARRAGRLGDPEPQRA